MGKAKKSAIVWRDAPQIKKRVVYLAKHLNLDWLKTSKIYCVRSTNANTRAIARIWGLGRIWQEALNIEPAYTLEVITEKFDRLSEIEKDKVLLHEITHIPKNFSGALVPHIRRGKRRFADKVHGLIYAYLKLKR